MATFEWLPEGLRCEIVLALSAKRSEARPTDLPQGAEVANRRRILVVEDEGLVGALTSELIDQMGYSALGPCVDINEAMTVMRRNHIDGAVLDVNLGGELVFPLARALADRAVPLVFLTGYEKTAVAEGFGAFPILQKPVAAERTAHVCTCADAQSCATRRFGGMTPKRIPSRPSRDSGRRGARRG